MTGRQVPVALAATGVLAEIAYPLTGGAARDRLTVATVVLLAAASVTHAAVSRGGRWAVGMVAVTAGGGLLAEAVGVTTGTPFGAYRYADDLGPTVAGVPLVVPLAWTMMAYPSFVAAGTLAGGRWRRVVVAGWALAAWDLFLDPQMVAAGHWTFDHPTPGLPGDAGVPLTNLAGWLGVALVMAAALATLLPPEEPARPVGDGVPHALYLWSYASSVLANLVFFGQPAVALVGGVAMGLVAVPLAVRVGSLARTGRVVPA